MDLLDEEKIVVCKSSHSWVSLVQKSLPQKGEIYFIIKDEMYTDSKNIVIFLQDGTVRYLPFWCVWKDLTEISFDECRYVM